jgi:hypothetical protein
MLFAQLTCVQKNVDVAVFTMMGLMFDFDATRKVSMMCDFKRDQRIPFFSHLILLLCSLPRLLWALGSLLQCASTVFRLVQMERSTAMALRRRVREKGKRGPARGMPAPEQRRAPTRPL